MSELKRTPLFSEYEKYGAKTIDFGGWDLPVQFSSIKAEHEQTRTKASLFDVSHMGEIFVKGTDSLSFLQKMTTNDVAKLLPNKAQYTFMCYENGGVVDDFLVYMLEDNYYLLVVNAANIEKDYEWLISHVSDEEDVEIKNESDQYGLLALQGPLAQSILQKFVDFELNELKPFSFKQNVKINDITKPVLISRTGYTGEDGFEIYASQEDLVTLWHALLEFDEEKVKPAGLGARDTLRFEAGLPLYGQELSKDITPIEANLKFAVKINKDGDFIGKDVLKKQVEEGTERTLVGLEMIDKGIPRTGYDVVLESGQVIGQVTTGTQAPTLKKNIGFAIINKDYSEIDTEVFVQVRKRTLKAKVIPTPFYKR